ncbi:Cleavage polyadenylation factor subunit clp1 [Elasticomyces elasticus]|nr:Cleavage polyadenylation factor subunit clp1 [Elasticomyces elasticus]
MTIYRAKPATGADDEDYDPSSSSAVVSTSATFEKITPSAAMTGSFIAIKFCPSNSENYTVRDSAVMGYLYVADVDEPRKKVRFLAPHPQRWGDRALVWAQWPEAVADLVT